MIENNFSALEPFGYFRAEPFGWTDCAETDEGAVALYDQETVNALQERHDELLKQRDELLAALAEAKIAMQDIGSARYHYDIVCNTIAKVKGCAE